MVLPLSMRLKGYRCFYHLNKTGKRFHGNSMVLRVVKAKPNLLKPDHRKVATSKCQLAVAISTKVSKRAVIRNRMRRLFHNHLRGKLTNPQDNSSHWALLSLKPNSLNEQEKKLLEECDRLFFAAGLIQ
ncbi:ribonuclease P protein component [Prochlorococcus sp. MIT 1341]|uniref:ribonuclease P protein component n=1 Tax=Prochlorococcus sp. MIT 1341 TaxID=3096221 RepID=UPI002A757AE0|nr:ribonuclease P protein component [Prochlorococcus sp. MIT 1341]